MEADPRRGGLAPGLGHCYIVPGARWGRRGKILMARRRQLYEGKAKILFEGPEPGTLVQYFKDDATAFNAKKKGVITEIGRAHV